MRKSMLTQAVVLGITLLFVGIIALPGQSNIVEKINKNPVVPLDNGLEGYWSFNEGSGTIAADSSGNGNTGTLVNNPAWVDGKFGKALHFDGVNDYVAFPTLHDFPSKTALTVSAWINSPLNSYGTIVYHGCGEFQLTNGVHYENPYNNPMNLSFWVHLSDGINAWYRVDSPILTANTWHHIVGVWSKGDYLRIYVDGSLANEVTIPNLYLFNASDWVPSIGTYDQDRGHHPTEFFNGTIDEVRIYNRALSQQEITDLFSIFVNVKGGLGVNLVIQNKGTTNEVNLQWQIHVTGGILGRMDITRNGNISTIAPGGSTKVGTGLFLGFGHIQVTFNVGAETGTATGKQMSILTDIKK